MTHSPLVVLGGGPGGYAAAFFAADEGAEVTLIEQEPRLGGTCLLRGCIPSKALLHVARVIAEVDELRDEWGVEYDAPNVSIDKVRARKEKVISTLSGGLKQLAKRRNVKVITAKGVFSDSNTIKLEGSDPSIPDDKTITFDRCIIATGSIPAMPPGFAIGSPDATPHRPAPGIGEHSRAVLHELGLAAGDIEALAISGVIHDASLPTTAQA